MLKAGQSLAAPSDNAKKRKSGQERQCLDDKEQGKKSDSRKVDGVSCSRGEDGDSVRKQKKGKEQPMFKRQKGESLKAYLERIDIESNARIMEAYRKTRGKRERRKRCVLVNYDWSSATSVKWYFNLLCIGTMRNE